MGQVRAFSLKRPRFSRWAATIAAILLGAWCCRAQSTAPLSNAPQTKASQAKPAQPQPAPAKPAGKPAEMPWTQDFAKYPGLLDELGHLLEKLQQDVQYPAPREASHLLPLLPPDTVSYAAIPNYGDVTRQTLAIFRQELQESSVLRAWWGHGKLAEGGPKIEEYFEKIYQLHEFLGDEIVISAAMEGQEPRFVVVAEVRKPGLKKFLQELIPPPVNILKPGVRVLDPQELATAKDNNTKPKDISTSKELVLLVRPDYVVATLDLATLRSFNARLEGHSKEFASTAFGQRIAKEYEGGVTALAAADLQKLMKQVPDSAKQNANFQRSGFGDVKYLVWDHKTVSGKTISQTELSFGSPRHGAASWLAKSAPLTNMDFVSPKAIFAGTVSIASMPQLFDDLKEMQATSSSNPFATLAAFEQMLKLSVRDDLLRYLSGEITVEMDNIGPPSPVWKAVLRVSDAERLQKTLSTLLTAGHLETVHSENRGVTYYAVTVPSGNTTMVIGYAFADGHLIVGSSPDVIAEAVRLHASGESLGKDPKFLAALPGGSSQEASALFYQDPTATTAMSMRQVAPELAGFLQRFSAKSPPAVFSLYGDESAIRTASKGGAFDVAAVLVVGAVAIPNLLRSRIAANEASAVGGLRSVNTAQVTYASTYPDRGFASDLAKFGTDPRGPANHSADHAGFLDESLAAATCTGDAWCTKSGYQFRVRAICMQHQCLDYVVVATPVDSNTGTRTFCSTSNGVIRYKLGSPLTAPITVAECKKWSPLQ
jgi:type IV pilus assembly protein PilA